MAIQRRETKTGKVRWVARWRDKGGREHSRSFDTKREAKQHLAEVTSRASRGVDTVPQRATLEEVYRAWLATRDVRYHTRVKYDDVLNIQLEPLLDYPIGEVTRADIVTWTNQLRTHRPWRGKDDKGLADSTVRGILIIMATMFNWAVAEGYTGVNPVKIPRGSFAIDPIEIPTRDEIERVIRALAAGGTQYYNAERDMVSTLQPNPVVADMVTIVLWTGLRVGELCGLAVGDVDLDAGVVHVRAQMSPDGRGRAEVKSRASRRDVPVAPALVPVLRRLVAGRDRGEWLFLSKIGTPMRPMTASTALQRVGLGLGVERVHFHSIRHFYVSSLLTAGVPVQDVARVAGHTPSITLQVYAHVLDGYQSRVAAAFSSPAFAGGGISAGSAHLRAVD